MIDGDYQSDMHIHFAILTPKCCVHSLIYPSIFQVSTEWLLF